MKRHLILSLGIAASLSLGNAHADQIDVCKQDEYVAYYQLEEPVVGATIVHSFTANFRLFEELEATDWPIVYMVCETAIPAFEADKKIHTGLRIHATELYEVNDISGHSVGVVWRDEFEPYDQGGAIGRQSYWNCPVDGDVIDNFAAFSSGFGASSINGASPEELEVYWVSVARTKVYAIDQVDMEGRGCKDYGLKEKFLSDADTSKVTLYMRSLDPDKGVVMIP